MREWRAFPAGGGGGGDGREAAGAAAEDVVRFVEWLPAYTAEVVSRLEQEVAWTSSTFPEEAGELVASAWVELSKTTEREFTARMSTVGRCKLNSVDP
jgi:hypothetical protein